MKKKMAKTPPDRAAAGRTAAGKQTDKDIETGQPVTPSH